MVMLFDSRNARAAAGLVGVKADEDEDATGAGVAAGVDSIEVAALALAAAFLAFFSSFLRFLAAFSSSAERCHRHLRNASCLSSPFSPSCPSWMAKLGRRSLEACRSRSTGSGGRSSSFRSRLLLLLVERLGAVFERFLCGACRHCECVCMEEHLLLIE